MAFQQALSGLSASAKAIDVTSNNIANASTVGFKVGSALFSDVYASALTGAASTGQVGIGSAANAVRQSFTQGGLTSTGNPLDMAINGNGFFIVGRNDGTTAYSRNGQFEANSEGFIVTSLGERLYGYQDPGPTGGVPTNASDPVPLRIPQVGINPQATSDLLGVPGVSISANLDSRAVPPTAAVPRPAWPAFDEGDPDTYDVQLSSITFNDDEGDPHTVDIYLRRQATGADDWEMFYQLDGGGFTSVNLSDGLSIPFTIASATDLTDETLTLNFDFDATTGWSLAADLDTVAVTTPTMPDEATVAFLSPTVTELVPFNQNDSTSYTSTTSLNVFDSLGGAHTLTVYFVKEPGEGGDWQVWSSLDGATATRLGNQTATDVLSFSQLGAPDGGLLGSRFNFGPVNLGADVAPLQFTIDLSATTQFGSSFAVTELDQNGYRPGELAGISIDRSGVIQGRYTNGETRDLGVIALATFRNPNGLVSVGNNLWAASPEAGEAIEGRPGDGLNGVISAGVVEDSNVDLTKELVQLIIMQRNYQANAQSIRTQDQLLQTVVNLR